MSSSDRDAALRIAADVSAYQAAISTIPGVTDKAAASAALNMEKRLSKGQEDAAKKAKKAAEEAGKAWEKGAGALKKMAGSLGFGGLANDIDDLIGGLGMMGGAAGVAAGGVAGIGLAGAAAAAGVYKIVAASDEALDRLDKLGMAEVVSPEQREAILAANNAIRAMGAAVDLVTVTLGANFAPAVEQAARMALELTLRSIEFFNTWIKGKSLLEEIAVWMGSTFIQVLTTPITMFAQLAEIVGAVGEAIGLQNNALSRLGQGWDDLTNSWSRSLIVGAEQTEMFQLNTDHADAFIAKLPPLTTGTNKAASSARDHADAMRDEAEAAEEAIAFVGPLLDDVEARWALVDKWEKMRAEREKASARAAEEAEKRRQQALDASIGAYSDLAGAISSAIETEIAAGKISTEEAKKRAKNAFALQKAAGLAQVGIDTARAIMATLADPLLIGPAKAAAVAAAVAAGATSAATIARQKAPVFKHVGGPVPQSDEVDMRLRRDEYVMTPQGRQSFGDAALQRGNGGVSEGGFGAFVVDFFYGHQALAMTMHDHLRANTELGNKLRSLEAASRVAAPITPHRGGM